MSCDGGSRAGSRGPSSSIGTACGPKASGRFAGSKLSNWNGGTSPRQAPAFLTTRSNASRRRAESGSSAGPSTGALARLPTHEDALLLEPRGHEVSELLELLLDPADAQIAARPARVRLDQPEHGAVRRRPDFEVYAVVLSERSEGDVHSLAA